MDLLVRPRVKNFIKRQLQRFRYRFIDLSFGSFLGKILRWDRPCANKFISIFHSFPTDDCITLYLSCHWLWYHHSRLDFLLSLRIQSVEKIFSKKNVLPHWVGPTTRSENLRRNINSGYALVSLEISLDNLGLSTLQCWGFSVSLTASIVLFRCLLASFSVCNTWRKSGCNVSSQARTEMLEFPRLLYAIDAQLNTKPI